MGTLMLAGGILGIILGTGILCALPGIFKRQREKLLEKIEKEP